MLHFKIDKAYDIGLFSKSEGVYYCFFFNCAIRTCFSPLKSPNNLFIWVGAGVAAFVESVARHVKMQRNQPSDAIAL